jgi:hypothetical protein
VPRKKLTEEQHQTVARLSAMKHGFARRLPIIPDLEDEADWKRHLKGIRDTFNPDGYWEEFLVRRLATTLWEVDRLTAYQVAATMSNIADGVTRMGIAANYSSGTKDIVEPDFYEVEERKHATLLPDDADLEIVMRYGNMLHRQWIQVHNQLITVQARRRGEKVPLAMVDVMGPPPNLGPHRSTSSQNLLGGVA